MKTRKKTLQALANSTRKNQDKMHKFDRIVNEVIARSDILLLVIDARRVEGSINRFLEKKLEKEGKKFIYVINKCDLITEEEQKKIKMKNSIQVSAMKHLSTMKLLRKIMEIGKGKKVSVGVIGYPNTGKSTVINALKGKHSAMTSSVSGYTKGKQKVKISQKITLIDTPGVIPYEDKEEIDSLIIGSIDANKVKDPELAAIQLIEELDGKIEDYFGVEKSEDAEETLEKIALKKNIVKKGKYPDTARMGKEIIMLWQKGKIR